MLILTSYGFRAPIVAEKLRNVVETKDKTVLIVPFAGFNNESCARRETEGLIEFGFKAENIFVYDKECAENNNKADYIYVPGGNTFKLLYEMKQCGAIEVIRNMVKNGSTYIGASAGAEVTTVDIEYVTILEDNNYDFEDYCALGFTDDIIIPHMDQRDHHLMSLCRRYADRTRLAIGIANDRVHIYDADERGEFFYVDRII